MRFKQVKVGDNTIVDTGLPQRGIKPAGLELHTHMMKRLFEIAEHPENMGNGSVRRLSRALINSIMDMAKRDEALDNIYRLIDEELPGEMSFTERARDEGEIWFDIAIREMTEYLDQAFAISHRLAVGRFSGNLRTETEHPEEPELDEGTELHEVWMEGIAE